MRTIDANRLLEERRIHTYYHLPNGDIAIPLIDIKNAPTIEPERKKGKWIYLDKDKRFFHPHIVKCSVCNNSLDMYGVNAGRGDANFCPNCGADMRTPVETARDIVHEAIDNSVWSDTVDTAKMHNVVDDKYVEMTKKTEESKRCDTCKHEKARWFSRCADCSDFELWESKE